MDLNLNLNEAIPVTPDGYNPKQDYVDDYFALVDGFHQLIKELDATPHDVILAAYHIYALEHNFGTADSDPKMHMRPSELWKRKKKFNFVD